jgi:hypothetical protein
MDVDRAQLILLKKSCDSRQNRVPPAIDDALDLQTVTYLEMPDGFLINGRSDFDDVFSIP